MGIQYASRHCITSCEIFRPTAKKDFWLQLDEFEEVPIVDDIVGVTLKDGRVGVSYATNGVIIGQPLTDLGVDQNDNDRNGVHYFTAIRKCTGPKPEIANRASNRLVCGAKVGDYCLRDYLL